MLFLGKGFLFGQVIWVPDSLSPEGSSIISQFYTGYPNDTESWQIHKEAYIKQLKSKGLAPIEIEEKVAAYEKRKTDFMEIVSELYLAAGIHSENRDVLREKASEYMQRAEEYRKQADKMLKEAREITEIHTTPQGQTEVHIQKAKKLRKEAEILMLEAEQTKRKAEESRRGFEKIFKETAILTVQSIHTEPIIVRVEKVAPLSFSIDCKISAGSALVEIFNPNGQKEGELSLEHKHKSDLMEGDVLLNATSGSLHKTISASAVGDWRIEITARNSEGSVDISVAQYAKPFLDE